MIVIEHDERIKTTIYLPRDLYRQLQHLAVDRNTSYSSLMELAARQLLAAARARGEIGKEVRG